MAVLSNISVSNICLSTNTHGAYMFPVPGSVAPKISSPQHDDPTLNGKTLNFLGALVQHFEPDPHSNFFVHVFGVSVLFLDCFLL